MIRSSRWIRRHLPPSLAVLGLTLLACTADQPFTESPGRPNGSGSLVAAASSNDTFTGTLGIADPYTDAGTLPTPDYGQYPALVEVTMSGYTYQIRNTDVPGTPHFPVGSVTATFDARPQGGCYVGAALQYFGNVNILPPPGSCGPHAPQASYTWLTPLSGPGNAHRTGASVSYYMGVPVSRYNGDITVTMNRIKAQLALVPDQWVVVKGRPVTFTARRVPEVYQTWNIPFQVLSWTWTPDSGPPPPPVPCGGTVCNFSPPTSGTMSVTAAVSGEVQTKSVHVRVLCAPTGVPALDSLPFLDAMSAAWDSAQGSNPDRTRRRERTWSIVCSSIGECQITFPPWDPALNPCQSRWPPTPTDSTLTQVGSGHIHPFVPGYPNPDTLPDLCPRDPKKKYPPGGRNISEGPSPNDYENGWAAQGNRTHCVMDGTYIYCFPTGVDPTTARNATKRIPRQQGNCRLALGAPSAEAKEEMG